MANLKKAGRHAEPNEQGFRAATERFVPRGGVTVSIHPRLLPWPGPTGQCSYLLTDHSDSYLSRLADEMEEVQLAMGIELLDHAAAMLEDRKAGGTEFRFLSSRLSEALRDALRVAESRGGRLAASEEDAEPGERSAADAGTAE
ncbi:hypothetical protein [Streptomyces chrestomyceticus]|uniref:hypothetical protein n=1 Tax=Streptomyces chrestomyceticus TaxID=68185 RepID=UPI003798E945